MRRAVLAAAALLVASCATAPSPRVDPGEPGDRRLLVTFRPAPSPLLDRHAGELAAVHGVRPVASWEMASLDRRCVVFAVPDHLPFERVARSLGADPRVEIVQPVQRFAVRAAATPPDPYRRLQHAADALRLDEAHRLATGRGVAVAVIDTGVDVAHPELHGRVIAARDFSGRESEGFTRDLHGTAVAGAIAAAADNGLGIVGVAPEAELLAIKACWPEPEGSRQAVCDSYTLALALDFAVNEGADVLNLSLAGPEDAILHALLDAALARGAVVVASADDAAGAGFPASLDGVVAVRALPRKGDAEPPPRPGVLAAPGDEILTTTPGGGFDFYSGPSLATAQVAGIAALLRQHRPHLRSPDVARLLADTARDNPTQSHVDACAAVAAALDVVGRCPG